jgi:hypothetical protein
MTMAILTTGPPYPRGVRTPRVDAHSVLGQRDDRAVPVWVHRLRADSLPTTETWSPAWPGPSSQRFVERWRRVASGY